MSSSRRKELRRLAWTGLIVTLFWDGWLGEDAISPGGVGWLRQVRAIYRNASAVVCGSRFSAWYFSRVFWCSPHPAAGAQERRPDVPAARAGYSPVRPPPSAHGRYGADFRASREFRPVAGVVRIVSIGRALIGTGSLATARTVAATYDADRNVGLHRRGGSGLRRCGTAAVHRAAAKYILDRNNLSGYSVVFAPSSTVDSSAPAIQPHESFAGYLRGGSGERPAMAILLSDTDCHRPATAPLKRIPGVILLTSVGNRVRSHSGIHQTASISSAIIVHGTTESHELTPSPAPETHGLSAWHWESHAEGIFWHALEGGGGLILALSARFVFGEPARRTGSRGR